MPAPPTTAQRVAALAAIEEFVGGLENRQSVPSTIRWYYGHAHAFDTGSGSCALVGSGATLLGRGLGPEIDSHDHVIRVNRLPINSTHYAHVGSRTSVWFSKICRLRPFRSGDRAALRLLVIGNKSSGNAEDVPSGYCWLAGPKASRCPHVEAFVARGGSNADNSSAKCHASGVRTLRTRTASVIPVGIQEETSFNAAIAMRHGREASTGLQALLTFAPHCRGGLSLYGFSGLGTADGHHIGHALPVEHELLANLSRRSNARIRLRGTR